MMGELDSGGASPSDRATHEQSPQAVSAVSVGIPDAWEYARSQGKSLLQTAPVDLKLRTVGDIISVECSMTTRQEMRAVCAIIQHLGEPWLPDAQGIEARQGQDAQRLDPKDESPVGNADAPKGASHD